MAEMYTEPEEMEEMEEMEDMVELVEVDEQEDAKLIFHHHTASVLCGSMNKNKTYAVTGGEDDKAYVWDVETGTVVLECTGHNDTVIFANFNYNEAYLATGDMNGFIQIWKIGDKKPVWDFNMGDASWMQWHPKANVLFGGAINGEVYMWKIPDGDCKIMQGYGQCAETAVLMPDGKRLAVGYKDGMIRVMDLKTCSVLATVKNTEQDYGHLKTITSMDASNDNILIMSSSYDGKTIVSNSHNGKVVSVLQDFGLSQSTQSDAGPSQSEDEEDSERNWAESVAFSKGIRPQIAASGTVNGELFIWDVTKQIVRHKVKLECGITKLVWKEGSSILLAACFDGVLRCFDGRSGECVRSYHGHTSNIFDLCLSKDGTTVLTASDDSTARIYEIEAHS